MNDLELKSYGSSDYDLESWQPAQEEDVFFVLDMEIGERGDDRADLFYVTVATPAGLRKHRRSAGTTSQGAIVLPVFSLDNLLARVNEVIADCSAESWDKSVLLLRRYFDYEYADYQAEE